ncbi:GMC oxidoreductase [Mycobacterium sp. JS623]|uniref:GMC oxidoreductase n=1 Tax=Mycobacterium sp. JS623 TaxID=212767 RepID=UPI003FA58E73
MRHRRELADGQLGTHDQIPPCPRREGRTVRTAELSAPCRVVGLTGTYYHPVGTCAMGTGPGAVVGPDLRVHGLTGGAGGRRVGHAADRASEHECGRVHDRRTAADLIHAIAAQRIPVPLDVQDSTLGRQRASARPQPHCR